MKRLMYAFMIMLLLACVGTASAGIEMMRSPGGSLDNGCPPSDVIIVNPTGGAGFVDLPFVAGSNECYRRDGLDHVVQLEMAGTGLLSMSYVDNIGTIHVMTECCGGREIVAGSRAGLHCIELGQGLYYVLFEIDSQEPDFTIRFEICEDPCELTDEALTEGESGSGENLVWVHTTDASDAGSPYYAGPWQGNWGCQDPSTGVNPTYGFGYYSWFHQDFGWSHWNGFYGEGQAEFCLEGDFVIDSAFVVICAYDVDFCEINALDSSDPCEHDEIKVNSTVVLPTYLQGINGGSANMSKSVTWFNIPLDLLDDNGSDVDVAIDIDKYSDVCTWATRVEWSKLVVYGTCRQIPEPQFFDLGDLGSNDVGDCSYNTNSLADGGPANALDDEIAWLGADVSPELVPNLDNQDDFDDGVEFLLNDYDAWWPCSTVCVNVTVTTGPGWDGEPLYLWAWKDGNLDCDFDDTLCPPVVTPTKPDECIIAGELVTGSRTGHVNNICFTDPGVYDLGRYDGYFRFRLMSMGPNELDCDSAQTAVDYLLGETEDYVKEDIQLAIELIGFDAVSQNGKIVLAWNTASETDNDHFELNRRPVGGNWQNVGVQIEGAGNSSSTNAYSYVDEAVTVNNTYQYQLISVDIRGLRTVAAETEALVIAGVAVVEEYKLYANFPNPFNPSTTITFDLKDATNVQLVVFDVLGREIASLVNGYQAAGRHTINFEAGALPSGVYFYRLETPQFTDMKKMMLLK
ncbi:T9SS type A sorting domain-containing protein [bacterium]|nr:T9SS type A sorting domain-containing protein [bacterium]